MLNSIRFDLIMSLILMMPLLTVGCLRSADDTERPLQVMMDEEKSDLGQDVDQDLDQDIDSEIEDLDQAEISDEFCIQTERCAQEGYCAASIDRSRSQNMICVLRVLMVHNV